jgi:hypothetical protein
MATLTEGTHLAKAVSLAYAESLKKGTPYIAIRFQGEAGSIEWQGWLTEGGMKSTMKGLRACGLVKSSPFHLTLADVPNPVAIVVENEEYNGKFTPKVKWINDPNAKPKDLDTAAQALLQQQLQSSIDEANASFTQGDIPF